MRITVLILLVLFSGSKMAHADGETYDESVNHAPPFSLNQNDPELSDLFNPNNGQSGLCVPTTLANIVADQAVWRTPSFPELQLVQTPEQGDYAQEVRYFVQHCGTDPVQGTMISRAVQCMRELYQQSGYENGWVYLIGMEENTDPQSVAFFHGPRPLTVDDIRYYVSNQVGVLMDVYWEKENNGVPNGPYPFGPYGNPSASQWSRRGGHTFMIAGYDYDFSWGQDQINLKVVNPENNYTTGDTSTHYDEVTMTSAQASGQDFPPGFSYVLSGPGFPSSGVRGYVRNIMVALPDHSIQPMMAGPVP